MAAARLDDWPPVVTAQRWWRTVFTPERLGSARFMLLFWFFTRLAVFLAWAVFAPSTQGDVRYYYSKIMAMDIVGPEYTMREYPTPVLWLLSVPRILGLGTSVGYVIAFVCCMLALDAVMAWSLWRTGGRYRGAAITFWTVFLLCVGPTAYLRFDLVPSVLAGWALLNVQNRRPGPAGVLIGAGAAIKLWPALMWPALLGGHKKGNIAATVGVFGFGGLLAVISLLWAGWDRLLSPLTWQSDRGLQVESIWATVPMAMRALGIGDHHVAISRYQAFEIWGTGVGFWLSAASLATLAGALLAVVAYLLWWRRPRSSRRIADSVALMLLVVLVMIVTNKTFSPQYIQWVGGPLAAGIVIAGLGHQSPEVARADLSRLKRMSVALLALTLLTQLVYPLGYGPLVHGGMLMGAVTLVLVVRNIGMVWLLWRVIGWVWSAVGPVPKKAVGALP